MPAATVLATLAAAAAAALAAGGAGETAATRVALPGVAPADVRLIAGYRSWQPLARPPVASLRSLGSAHAADGRRIWINRTRAQLRRRGRAGVPHARGTVVVKELRLDGFIEAIALMQKTGRGPDGWRWIEYKRGSAREPFRKLELPQSLCSGCHLQATRVQRTDGVFWRLR